MLAPIFAFTRFCKKRRGVELSATPQNQNQPDNERISQPKIPQIEILGRHLSAGRRRRLRIDRLFKHPIMPFLRESEESVDIGDDIRWNPLYTVRELQYAFTGSLAWWWKSCSVHRLNPLAWWAPTHGRRSYSLCAVTVSYMETTGSRNTYRNQTTPCKLHNTMSLFDLP